MEEVSKVKSLTDEDPRMRRMNLLLFRLALFRRSPRLAYSVTLLLAGVNFSKYIKKYIDFVELFNSHSHW